MEHSIFLEISLIIAVATIVATIMRSLRQPLMIGHIITGLLVGPYVLNIVHSRDTVDVFSNLGIALLLFIIGLGLNPRVIKEVGKVATFTGAGQVLFTSLIGGAIASALGFDFTSALFIAIALSFSSTIIILKLLSDKKEQSRLYGKISTGFLLVQDIIATFVLIAVAANSNGGLAIAEMVRVGLLGFGLIAGLLVLSWYVLPRLTNFVASTPEYLFLFAIAWGFGLAALFALAGLSIEIGALFAGVSLASLPYAQEISSRLRPLRDFFIVLFFIALGTRLGVENLSAIVGPAVLLSGFVLVGNPLIVMSIMGLLGYTKKTSFKAGLTVAQISEFSLILVILGERVGQISAAVVSLVTLVAIITIAVSTYMIIYSDQLYEKLEPHLRLFERRHAKSRRSLDGGKSPDVIIFGYKKGGEQLMKIFSKFNKKSMIIDYDPEVVDNLEHEEVPHMYGDATDSELLDSAGIAKAKVVISALTDFRTNLFIVNHAKQTNPNAVVVVQAESRDDAVDLYEHGATYVMMPHYIGSEKITSLIKRHNAKKDTFKKARQKHLAYLQAHSA